jgi:hypothetical protein
LVFVMQTSCAMCMCFAMQKWSIFQSIGEFVINRVMRPRVGRCLHGASSRGRSRSANRRQNGGGLIDFGDPPSSASKVVSHSPFCSPHTLRSWTRPGLTTGSPMQTSANKWPSDKPRTTGTSSIQHTRYTQRREVHVRSDGVMEWTRPRVCNTASNEPR